MPRRQKAGISAELDLKNLAADWRYRCAFIEVSNQVRRDNNMNHNLQQIGKAIELISTWLREVSEYVPSVSSDPQDDRNHAIRELVIAFLEYQFRRANQGLPPVIASLDSTRVIHLLEQAAEAHQKFMSFE